MKKILFAFVFFFLFGLVSCQDMTNKEEEIEDIEVTEHMKLQYEIGENFNDLRFSGGKLKVTLKNGEIKEHELKHESVKEVDYKEGLVKVDYNEHEVYVKAEGYEYIGTNEELKAIENKEGIYIIKEGQYELNYLYFTKSIALIGDGNVKIKLTGARSGHAAGYFQGNTTLVNLEIESTYNESLINSVKVGKIEVDGNLDFIEKFYASDITLIGGKGLNIMAVKKARLDNIDVKVDSTVKNVALAISSGSDVVLKNSKVANGTWGSIAVFGVNETSTKEFYKRKNILSIFNTEISSSVYVEYYSVNKSQVNGLETWKITEENDYRVFTKE